MKVKERYDFIESLHTEAMVAKEVTMQNLKLRHFYFHTDEFVHDIPLDSHDRGVPIEFEERFHWAVDAIYKNEIQRILGIANIFKAYESGEITLSQLYCGRDIIPKKLEGVYKQLSTYIINRRQNKPFQEFCKTWKHDISLLVNKKMSKRDQTYRVRKLLLLGFHFGFTDLKQWKNRYEELCNQDTPTLLLVTLPDYPKSREEVIGEVMLREGYQTLSIGNQYIVKSAIDSFRKQHYHDEKQEKLLHKTFLKTVNAIIPSQNILNAETTMLFMFDHIRSIMKQGSCTSPYEFEQYLSNGMYGVTFIAKHKKSNDKVVIKVSDISVTTFLNGNKNESRALIYNNEVKCMNVFYQENIGVKIIDHCVMNYMKKEYGVIVMEKLDGVLGDIITFISEVTDVESIPSQIITILETMKTAKISHNDMHLANIGFKKNIDGTCTLKLIDFGASKLEPRQMIAPPDIFHILDNIESLIMEDGVNVSLMLKIADVVERYIKQQTEYKPSDMESLHKKITSIRKYELRKAIMYPDPTHGVEYLKRLLDNGAVVTKEEINSWLYTLIHDNEHISVIKSIVDYLIQNYKISPTELMETAYHVRNRELMDHLNGSEYTYRYGKKHRRYKPRIL